MQLSGGHDCCPEGKVMPPGVSAEGSGQWPPAQRPPPGWEPHSSLRFTPPSTQIAAQRRAGLGTQQASRHRVGPGGSEQLQAVGREGSRARGPGSQPLLPLLEENHSSAVLADKLCCFCASSLPQGSEVLSVRVVPAALGGKTGWERRQDCPGKEHRPGFLII